MVDKSLQGSKKGMVRSNSIRFPCCQPSSLIVVYSRASMRPSHWYRANKHNQKHYKKEFDNLDFKATHQKKAVKRHPAPQPDVTANPRRLRISMKMLEDYGYTENCSQCDHVRSFGKAKGGMQHQDVCRSRIMEAMAQSPEGQRRLQPYETRRMVAISLRADVLSQKYALGMTSQTPEGQSRVQVAVGSEESLNQEWSKSAAELPQELGLRAF